MKTNKTASVAVGTTRKSIETRQPTWLSRNVRQVCDGGFGCRTRYLVTVAWLTSIPSFNNSPWMRGAPHNRFSRLIRWMSLRISFEICGRPDFPWRDFHFQNKRNPWRCPPTTVSGLTMTRASFQRGHRRERKTQNTRSSGRSRGRGLSRFKTTTCWRRAMFSSRNDARLRSNSRMKVTRNLAIVCMLQTVAGSGLKCREFRGRRNFEERHPGRARPAAPTGAASPQCSQSSMRSKQSLTIATRNRPDDPAPSARHARALQVNILPIFSLSWLHPLKSWSLRKTRCGSLLKM